MAIGIDLEHRGPSRGGRVTMAVNIFQKIIDKQIHHGLTYRPSKSLDGDFVKPMPGVFSLLYEKRMGAVFGHDRLAIKRLLARCPELGSEVLESTVTTADTA